MRRIFVGAPAVALALVLAGCGASRADKVDAYFRAANAVQADFAGRFAAVNHAYAAFSRGRATAAQRASIVRAPTLFAELYRRLAALHPPDDARSIHRDLLRLVSRSRSLAIEARSTMRYIPAFGNAVAPVGPASARLAKALRGKQTPSSQAVAFRRFADALRDPIIALRRLDPPPALRPSRTAQLRRLARARSVVSRLAHALGAHDRRALPGLAVELRRIARPESVRVQADAIRAYNRRVGAILALASRIDRERRALQRELG